MKHPYIFFGSCVFTLLGILSVVMGGQTVRAATCNSDPSLSYYQAVDTHADGSLDIQFSPDLSTNIVTATIVNNTECSVPLSLASYKMFGPFDPAHLSEQEFFDGSQTITVAASSTATLSVKLPLCMTQYDIWYGDVQRVLVDNHVYGEFIAGDNTTVRPREYCTNPVTPPGTTTPPTATSTPDVATSTLHIVKHVINDNGGTASSSDFSIHLKFAGIDVSGSPFAGVESPGMSFIFATGTYAVSEDVVAGYASSFSGDCDSGGIVALIPNDNKTCIITNDDRATTTPVEVIATTTPPIVTSGGSGGCTDGCGAGGSDEPYVPPVSTRSSGSSGSYVGIPQNNTYVAVPMVLGASDIAFPNAGFGPSDNMFPWEILGLFGLLLLFPVTVGTYVYVKNTK